MQHLVNAMTVNETYFLREDYQFDSLVNGILPEIARTKIAPVPSGSGQFLARRARSPIPSPSVSSSAGSRPMPGTSKYLPPTSTPRSSQEARSGLFGPRSLSRVQPYLRTKYFCPPTRRQLSNQGEIRDSIDFSLGQHGGPVADAPVPQHRRDILPELADLLRRCGRRQTVEMFFEALAPGGYICLGHSESMSRMSSVFLPRKFHDTIVYQKPRSAE